MKFKIFCSTIVSLICATCTSYAQNCEPQYVGSTVPIESIAITGTTLIEMRPTVGIDIFDATDSHNLIKLANLPLPFNYESTTFRINPLLQADANTAAVQTSDTTIQLIDLSDPSSPSLRAELSYAHEVTSHAIKGDHIVAITYPGSGNIGTLFIHDITDTANPQLLTQASALRDSRLYISNNAIISKVPGSNDYQVHDLTAPVDPIPASTISGWEHASIQGDVLALIKPGMIGFYDLSDPASPTPIRTINANTYSTGSSSLNSFKYVGDYLIVHFTLDETCFEDVWVYTVSETHNINRVHTYFSADCEAFSDTLINQSRMFVLNNKVITLRDNLYEYTDLSQSFDAVAIQNSPAWGLTTEYNGYVYGTNLGHLRIGLPATLDNLEPVAEIEIESDGQLSNNLYILGFVGDIAVISSTESHSPRDQFVTTVDVSDPTMPQIIERTRFGASYQAGNFIYTLDNDDDVLRVAEVLPTGQLSPYSETPIASERYLYARHIDNRLYLIHTLGADFAPDFQAYDFTDPMNPEFIFGVNYNDLDLEGATFISGNLAYFKKRFRDFATLDFSDPSTPLITSYPNLLPDNTNIIGQANDFLYFIDPFLNLYTIDISQPNLFPVHGPFSTLRALPYRFVTVFINNSYLEVGDLSTIVRYDISACAPEPCPADLTDDGILSFFDVSAFLGAYASQSPVADFTGDGTLNFFDISAFLNAYTDGCP